MEKRRWGGAGRGEEGRPKSNLGINNPSFIHAQFIKSKPLDSTYN